ncbi:tumor necrosis factor receptor-associated factor 6 [Apostichopus japonicus]|uniref:Tumor necrosis factor receptor-associated factor 6 n=3 Tax=Stichopus japonicus TaxID=307972 RepID=A0A2G8K6Y3_STIJA|nr:tumor necrosis factor receptor-associated factor 6 [Apostichopus japonicus]
MEFHMRDSVYQHIVLLANGVESLNMTGAHRLTESDDYGDYSGLPHHQPNMSEYGMPSATSFGMKGSKGKSDYQSYMEPLAKGHSSAAGGPMGPPLPSLLHAKDSYSPQELSQYMEHILKWTHAMQERERKQTKKIQDLEHRLLHVEKNYKHNQAHTNRFCNGTFIWRLQNYMKMRDDAMKGATSVQHSDGFYTALYGYKLCIRVNINATDSIRGAYISLFVHFMKGEYDNIVEWPFKGCISLSILDQTEDCLKRKHLRETLIAKSELLAFHRPTSYRNHKGFGYMEFAPLSVLENGSYLKNDSFYIKVEVNTG